MWLFDRVRDFFRRNAPLALDERGQPADLELQVATAVLLLEAAYGDQDYAWSEHRAIVRALEHGFGLGHRQVLEILGRAEEIRPPVVQLRDVTDVVSSRFDVEQRKQLLRLLWSVIEADDVLAEWEQSFADHVARAVGLDAAEARAARTLAPEAGD